MIANNHRWSWAIAFLPLVCAACQSDPTRPLEPRFQPKVATRILPVTPDRIVLEADDSGWTFLPLSYLEKLRWAELCNRKLDALCGDADLLIGPARATGLQTPQEVHILDVHIGKPPPGIGCLFIPEQISPEFVFIGLCRDTRQHVIEQKGWSVDLAVEFGFRSCLETLLSGKPIWMLPPGSERKTTQPNPPSTP